MKKMMIIAAMVSMMLIPAQMEAKNKVNNKPKVEYNNKKFDNKKPQNKFDDKKSLNKFNQKFDKKKDYKKNNYKKPNKPVIVVKKPAPNPAPVKVVKVVNEVNPVNAVASVIGLVALAAIIAN